MAIRNEPFGQYPGLVAAHGLVPNLFRAQNELPRVVEAAERLIDAVVVRENVLSRPQKESLLHGVASVLGNDYCQALYGRSLRAVSDTETALLRFAGTLAGRAPWFSGKDVQGLREAGFDDAAILESVVTTALGRFLCTLADALQPDLDPGLALPASSEPLRLSKSSDWVDTPGPYLQQGPRPAEDFPPYASLREQYGFVPNLFRVQTLRPDVLEAEVEALEKILLPEGHLSRIQKESILLVISAANLNTYWVSVQGQMLSALGVPPEESDQFVEDYQGAPIQAAEIVLLDEVRKLARPPTPSRAGFDREALRAHGFSEAQIVEAVAMSALANFLNTLQAGLGAVPDFPPRRVFGQKDLYRFSGQARPTCDTAFPDDPDADVVARVQNGDVDAFEDLVRRHTRRIMATLTGIVGNMDDARDATQDVFLKAFEHIDRFQRRSKFSTWLMSIAINTGTEFLRQRKPCDSLENVEDEEGFRPRQLQSWADSPEQQVAAAQRGILVREGVLRLPEKYRVAVLLRDISQLSTEESAAALGLSVPALKARVLRGRLMLRESLAPHFTRAENRSPDAQLR
ncbi:MAG: sigma-70 family RNA polymerase sigma factor [Terriglobales bacterium]